MPPQSRFQDMGVGICTCHKPIPIPMSGMILTCSSSHIIGNMGAARTFDTVLGFCGDMGIMITSSSTMFIDNMGACRVGDMFTGCFIGKLITGESTYITGG